MAKASVIVVGSGAGASAAAWALRQAGHPVLILEKGRHLLPGLGTPAGPRIPFGNDEVKPGRAFENQDPVLEPRTSRTQQEASQGVDRSFVGALSGSNGSGAIVDAILRMAHALDLEVVAEGLETTEHLDVLRRLGCRFGQGYLFSRPVDVSAASALLEAGRVGADT